MVVESCVFVPVGALPRSVSSSPLLYHRACRFKFHISLSYSYASLSCVRNCRDSSFVTVKCPFNYHYHRCRHRQKRQTSLTFFFSFKEPHKRSQLWRMTGEGLLRHEGSSPPSAKPSSANAGLVLDIDSLAPPTCGKYVRLVLSKPNPRRLHSQTWSFTEVSLVLV